MGNIKVKLVTDADAEQIKGLYKEAGWWDEKIDNDPNLIKKIIKGSFCFAAAFINDRIIGMGRAISDGASDAYIQDIVVLKEFRGKGIGVLIMDELIKHLKSKNIDWISLISEPDTVLFYQKYGFSQMTNFLPFTLK